MLGSAYHQIQQGDRLLLWRNLVPIVPAGFSPRELMRKLFANSRELSRTLAYSRIVPAYTGCELNCSHKEWGAGVWGLDGNE